MLRCNIHRDEFQISGATDGGLLLNLPETRDGAAHTATELK